ncbi:hypothetical protein CWB79_13840 [Pseudoalteromonas sp. S1649]|nr:hypothetical protein CWB80_09795 [Pseudoalteromonas sp. S1650]TMP66051.1 hypothetical protein CWB79_13840 [Pseudoalteromonas sp. S1649]
MSLPEAFIGYSLSVLIQLYKSNLADQVKTYSHDDCSAYSRILKHCVCFKMRPKGRITWLSN